MVATARKPSAAADLQALQASSGGRLTVTELDVAEPQSIEHWADAVEARVRHVDVIFNNAGVTDRWKGLHEVTYQDLVHCYAVNAVGECAGALSLGGGAEPAWVGAEPSGSGGMAGVSMHAALIGLCIVAACVAHTATCPSLTHPAGPLLVVQQLHQRGLLGGSGGESLVANVTSKAGWAGLGI